MLYLYRVWSLKTIIDDEGMVRDYMKQAVFNYSPIIIHYVLFYTMTYADHEPFSLYITCKKVYLYSYYYYVNSYVF